VDIVWTAFGQEMDIFISTEGYWLQIQYHPRFFCLWF